MANKKKRYFPCLPIGTASHAPMEFFIYRFGVPPTWFRELLISKGWKDKEGEATPQALENLNILISDVKSGNGKKRHLYSKDAVWQMLNETTFFQERKSKPDPVVTIVRLFEEIRKTRPSKRQVIFDEIARKIAQVTDEQRVMVITRLRELGINPARPYDGARPEGKRRRSRSRKPKIQKAVDSAR